MNTWHSRGPLRRANVSFISTAAALALSLVLVACGGGGDRVILPVDDAAPQAYTTQYLAQHPNAVIQPEHLLVANLDPKGPNGGTVSVRVQVHDELSIQMGSSADSPAMQALSEVIVADAFGNEKMHYREGQALVQIDLQPGEHVVTFVPKAGLTQARTVFMKLAYTPTQIARQTQGTTGLLGASGPTLQSTQFGENCNACDFDNSDLTGANFYQSGLAYSTFHNALLSYANFQQSFCNGCSITSDATPTYELEDTNFNGADLQSAVLDRPYYTSVGFKGVRLDWATVRGVCMACDFTPFQAYPDLPVQPATFTEADLTGAQFDNDNPFTSAIFTNAKVSAKTFQLSQGTPGAMRNAFTGVVFDNLSPGTGFVAGGQSFAGYDLSGTSFTGIDLSTQDFSVGAGTTMTAATNISQAILSNDTVGINLSGQAFPAAYTGFAGTVADAASGRDLTHVNLTNVSLYEADLTRARLDGAILVGADLTYANLYAASLRGAQLGVAPGSGTQVAARLSNAYMPLADLSDADLRSADLSNVHLYGQGTKLDRARLDGASLVGAMLMQASFVNVSFNNANLGGASLVGANFDAAVLSNAKLDAAYLQGANFASAASLVGADFTNSVVSTDSGAWSFTEMDGTPFSFPYSPTALGQIATSSQVICPNGDTGPCTTAKLAPIKTPPYPLKPPCTPLRKYLYMNCEAGWVPPTS